MKENQIRDINTAMYESTKLLQASGNKPRYTHIIVDEGQDFSDNAYRLLRALAGEDHANDIFIVGDSHQRIYKKHVTLVKNCFTYVKPERPDDVTGKKWAKARNTSLILPNIAEKIAELKCMMVKDVVRITEENTRRVFKLNNCALHSRYF